MMESLRAWLLSLAGVALLTALVVALFLAVPYWKTIVLPKKKEV